MSPRTLRLTLSALLVAAGIVAASSALAVPQFVPTGTSRLHTPSSGQPGAEWNTSGLGSGGELSYDSGTGVLTLTGVLDVLNYWDSANGSCATDAGSNCALNYSPDLDFTLTASHVRTDAINITGPIFRLESFFETTGSSPDLTLTDPADGGAVQLEADLVSGTFNGDPITGIFASVLYNSSTGETLFQAVNGGAILNPNGATPYGSLFGSGDFGLSLATLSDFATPGGTGDLSEIATQIFVNGGCTASGLDLLNCDIPVDLTAEANGQVFEIPEGEFVIPEPATGILVAGGLVLLGIRRRQS